MTLEEAVPKMTSLPAQRLNLRDRGITRDRTWADLVIFNCDRILDKSTYEQPSLYPEGIEHVNGQHTGRLPGKVLRHAPLHT